jgi:TusA-related sulfurtransferase
MSRRLNRIGNIIQHEKIGRWEEKMDACLDREIRHQATIQHTEETIEGQKIQFDKELNLKGKVCPYTFIESMLALEEMKIDEVLRVIVDYPPAVCDVPKSLKNEGYEILDVSPVNETDWAIVVKNTEFK